MMANLFFACILGFFMITNGEFKFWDHCFQSRINCGLGQGLVTFGSGYAPNKSKWYIVGGSGIQPSRNVLEIGLPTSFKNDSFTCDTVYPEQLPQAFSQNEAAVFDDVLYSFGGVNTSFSYIDNVYKSNINTQSAFENSLPAAPFDFSAACSVTTDDSIYIIGGLSPEIETTTQLPAIETLLKYNATANEWTQLASMSISRFAPGCVIHNNKIYVFGGEDKDLNELNTIEIYDISTDMWTLSNTTLTYNAHWITSAYINAVERHLALIMGGIAGFTPDFSTIDVYDIDLDAIIDTVSLPRKRYAFRAITPYHGNWERNIVLFAGGKSISTVYNSIDYIQCQVTKAPTVSPVAIPDSSASFPVTISMCNFFFYGFILFFTIML
mmetsp:Transcript_9589/g.12006  ORF Transcript_9589/g.12006 Transcript_9589/m.12006 type:complete len:382 (+) Transcript_9589:64-1209(+)